jgi:hypothetical protein
MGRSTGPASPRGSSSAPAPLPFRYVYIDTLIGHTLTCVRTSCLLLIWLITVDSYLSFCIPFVQYEGAVNLRGKNIWDTFAHTSGPSLQLITLLFVVVYLDEKRIDLDVLRRPKIHGAHIFRRFNFDHDFGQQNMHTLCVVKIIPWNLYLKQSFQYYNSLRPILPFAIWMYLDTF